MLEKQPFFAALACALAFATLFCTLAFAWPDPSDLTIEPEPLPRAERLPCAEVP